MSRKKYLDDIDRVLIETFLKKSEDIGSKNFIKFSKELENSGAIRKIAFDVYKVDNDPYDNMWVLEDIDGVAHLVRASDPQYENEVSGDWKVTSSYDRTNITLSYKDTPITRFSSSDYGFNKEDIISFRSAILSRVKEDREFLKEVLAEQPQNKKETLVSTYPELLKLIREN